MVLYTEVRVIWNSAIDVVVMLAIEAVSARYLMAVSPYLSPDRSSFCKAQAFHLSSTYLPQRQTAAGTQVQKVRRIRTVPPTLFSCSGVASVSAFVHLLEMAWRGVQLFATGLRKLIVAASPPFGTVHAVQSRVVSLRISMITTESGQSCQLSGR